MRAKHYINSQLNCGRPNCRSAVECTVLIGRAVDLVNNCALSYASDIIDRGTVKRRTRVSATGGLQQAHAHYDHCTVHTSPVGNACEISLNRRGFTLGQGGGNCPPNLSLAPKCFRHSSSMHRRRSGWNSEGDAWRAPKVGRCRIG